MGCSKCKEKKRLREEFEKTTKYQQNGVIVFFIFWSMLSLYGIYSLIINFL